MTIASENSVVELIYSLTEAGSSEVIDSNDNTNPLEFITGKGRLIIGLERALAGMNEGESADVMVKAEEAYGEYNPEALQTIPEDYNFVGSYHSIRRQIGNGVPSAIGELLGKEIRSQFFGHKVSSLNLKLIPESLCVPKEIISLSKPSPTSCQKEVDYKIKSIQ